MKRSLYALLVGCGLLVLAAPPPAAADWQCSSQDFFLVGTAPDLYLSNAEPIGPTPKFKDSPAIKRSGGNQYKEIGTWDAGGPNQDCTLSALSDLHIWVGLRNSDDQGTQFDILAEILKNDQVVASGTAVCVKDVTRNPSKAKEVVIEFDLPLPATYNSASDELSLRLSAAIGTGPGCTGHANATGLRVYYDSGARDSRFDATLDSGGGDCGSGCPPS